MARLAKCWNATIICNEFLFGRSYTFELLGIQAGREEEETKQKIGVTPSIVDAFTLFLKMVLDIETQRILFTYSEDFYSESDTPIEVLNQTPLILDPSSPYNNVMSTFSPLAQHLFSDCAKETLKRLDRAEKQIEMDLVFPHLTEIFLPQLTPLASPIRMPQNWLIQVQSEAVPLQPRVIVRNAALNKETRSQIAQFHKAFSTFMSVFDIVSNYDIPGGSKISAKQSITRTIDHIFRRKRKWIPCDDMHDNRDVTFEIPIGPFKMDYLVISSDWK